MAFVESRAPKWMTPETKQAEWYEAAVENVANGVYRIPLPLPGDGLRAVNVYLIAGEDGSSVCVDSGWAVPAAREVFVRSLATLGFGLEDIGRFLVTHIHRDHYTQAIAIRREVPTKVSLGAGERDSLELLCGPQDERRARRLDHLVSSGASDLAKRIERAWSAHPPTIFDFEMPDDWLRDGDFVDVPGRRLGVVETPGHTRGHVVFHDADSGVLFAGDHVLPTITPSIGVEVSPYANALGDFLASLARVRPASRRLAAPSARSGQGKRARPRRRARRPPCCPARQHAHGRKGRSRHSVRSCWAAPMDTARQASGGT